MDTYAGQKAFEAAMATRAGSDLDKGLESAAISLSLFPVDQVPDSIKRRYYRIHDQLTMAPDDEGKGTISAAISLLPEDRKRSLDFIAQLDRCLMNRPHDFA